VSSPHPPKNQKILKLTTVFKYHQLLKICQEETIAKMATAALKEINWSPKSANEE
jgi:hypothetical protein